MFNKTQILKGFLEGFILKTLEYESLYSGDIIARLEEKKFFNLSEGTLYPLLLRLEDNGLLSSKRIYNALGPSRKIYAITDKGKEELDSYIKEWKEFSEVCNNILGEIRK